MALPLLARGLRIPLLGFAGVALALVLALARVHRNATPTTAPGPASPPVPGQPPETISSDEAAQLLKFTDGFLKDLSSLAPGKEIHQQKKGESHDRSR